MPLLVLALALLASAWGQDSDALKKAKKGAGGMDDAAGAPVALFELSFTEDPVAEDHTVLRPGPAGGADLVYGFTDGRAKFSIRAPWEQGEAVDGKVPVYTKAVKVDFRLVQTVYVTSAFEGCPYGAVLAHEKAHAKAFSAIYFFWKKALETALDKSQSVEPRIGTCRESGCKDAVWLAPEEVKKYKAQVKAKVEKVASGQAAGSGGLYELWEMDRSDKDAPRSYTKVYDACPDKDWKDSIRGLREALKKAR